MTTKAKVDETKPAEGSEGAIVDTGKDTGARLEAPVNLKNSGPTAAEAEAEAAKDGHVTGEVADATRAEGEVPGTQSHTAPGDAPHDTTDPRERVVTATPSGRELAEAAKEGLGSVVAYVKVGEIGGGNADDDDSEDRIERYEVVTNAMTGETVTVERNIDTGVSKRV